MDVRGSDEVKLSATNETGPLIPGPSYCAHERTVDTYTATGNSVSISPDNNTMSVSTEVCHSLGDQLVKTEVHGKWSFFSIKMMLKCCDQINLFLS